MAQPLDAAAVPIEDANRNITTMRVLKEDELLAHQIANGQVTVYQQQTVDDDEAAQQQYITLSRKFLILDFLEYLTLTSQTSRHIKTKYSA